MSRRGNNRHTRRQMGRWCRIGKRAGMVDDWNDLDDKGRLFVQLGSDGPFERIYEDDVVPISEAEWYELMEGTP